MPRGIRVTFPVPEPVTRQATVVHEMPSGGVCSNHDVSETFTYLPMREVVLVKTTCDVCLRVGLRLIPEDTEGS